ncbi:hypothetical protein AB0M43_23580 [Longispora sp. NPDC051575]|uniref:hypothetical protein n=1 Tax=Longispora sp. NPDC051575 TaxID=3154943 RepID=UPI00343C9471
MGVSPDEDLTKAGVRAEHGFDHGHGARPGGLVHVDRPVADHVDPGLARRVHLLAHATGQTPARRAHIVERAAGLASA